MQRLRDLKSLEWECNTCSNAMNLTASASRRLSLLTPAATLPPQQRDSMRFTASTCHAKAVKIRDSRLAVCVACRTSSAQHPAWQTPGAGCCRQRCSAHACAPWCCLACGTGIFSAAVLHRDISMYSKSHLFCMQQQVSLLPKAPQAPEPSLDRLACLSEPAAPLSGQPAPLPSLASFRCGLSQAIMQRSCICCPAPRPAAQDFSRLHAFQARQQGQQLSLSPPLKEVSRLPQALGRLGLPACLPKPAAPLSEQHALPAAWQAPGAGRHGPRCSARAGRRAAAAWGSAG